MKLLHLTVVMIVIALLAYAPVADAQHANVPLKIVFANTDSVTATGGYIYFGYDKTATYCLDASLGEAGLPPLPLAGTFDARFTDPRGVNPDCTDQGTLRDYRTWASGTAQIDTFAVSIQKGSVAGNYVFSWPSGLSQYYTSLQLVDAFSIINVNMLVDTVKVVGSPYNTFGNFTLNIIANQIVNSVKRINDGIPKSFSLSQNYPNPFNPSTKIQFTVQKSVMADVAIYDVLGRRVKVLASQQINPGTYSAEWNGVDEHGNNVGSGVYFVRMTANDASTGQAVFSAVRKLMLAK